MKNYIKLSAILFCSFFSYNIFGQFTVSDIYVSGGFQDTRFNKLIYEVYVPISSNINEKEFSGLKNIGFGIITKLKQNSKLSFDLSFDYLLNKSHSGSFETYKTFEGAIISNFFGDYQSQYGPSVKYDFSYEFSSFFLSITPTYNLFSKNKFSLDLGIGLNYHKPFYKQKGVEYIKNESKPIISSIQGEKKFNQGFLGVQSNINFGTKLTSKVYLDFQLKFKYNKINDFFGGSTMGSWYISNNFSTYPINEPSVDYTGFNYMLRLRYRLPKA